MARYVANSNHPLRFFVDARRLVGCTDSPPSLRMRMGAPHQCPVGPVVSYLIYADNCAHIPMMHHISKGTRDLCGSLSLPSTGGLGWGLVTRATIAILRER